MNHETLAALGGIFVACAFGIPVSEDVALFSAGLLVSAGNHEASVIFVVAWTAIAFGDISQFMIGRMFGPRVFEHSWTQRLISPERRAAMERKLRQWGPLACFGARFLPGARVPMYLVAGASGVRPLLFLGLDGVAAAVSTTFWLCAGYHIGGHARDAFGLFVSHRRAFTISAVLIVIGGLTILQLWRGRRHSRRLSES